MPLSIRYNEHLEKEGWLCCMCPSLVILMVLDRAMCWFDVQREMSVTEAIVEDMRSCRCYASAPSFRTNSHESRTFSLGVYYESLPYSFSLSCGRHCLMVCT